MTEGVERSKVMEVPYEREEEEVIGVEDLQTRRRSSHSHPPNYGNSSTSSDSSFTSESSNSSFEYSVSMDATGTTNTNGENPKIIEGRSVIEEALSQAEEEEAKFEEPKKRENDINVAQNGDSNGFTVKQNGGAVVEYSLPETNGRDKETDEMEPVTSSFSKSPESDVGLKYVESLLDESSNGVNGMPPEIYNGENIVNKTLIINGQTEIVETDPSQEVELEGEVFDVERVVKEQKTHDFYCPYCEKCITERVILKRRKRKLGEISKDEPAEVKPGQLTPMLPETKSENKPSQDKRAPDAPLDAISCFSCFSIFISKGDGFLCWRFKSKPAIALHPDDPSAGYIDPSEQATDVETGRVFPLWILTCCQPYHSEKPAPGPKPPLKSEKGTEVLPDESGFPTSPSQVTDVLSNKSELPSSPSHGTDVPPHESELPSPPSHDKPVPQPLVTPEPDLPPSTEPVEDASSQPDSLPPVTSKEGKGFPLWILTCCQPSTDPVKSEHSPTPGAEVPTYETNSALALSDDPPIISKPLTPIDPVDETKSPPEQQPPAASGKEKELPLWFLTCCQPASEENKQKHQDEQDLAVPTHEGQHPSLPSKDAEIQVPFEQKPIATSESGVETQKPSEQKPLVTSVGGTGFPLWFVTCCQPSLDGTKPKPAKNPDEKVPSPESNLLTTNGDGTEFHEHENELPTAPFEDTTAPHVPLPPIIGEPVQPSLLKPIKIPEDTPSPPEPEPPSTPPKGDVIVQMPEEPKPEPSGMLPGPSESGPSTDITQSLLVHPREPPRRGVSGVDIVKAIVYGGLLECITSLSIITSAAGGDATTLNIVALGLANVFGGLIVLLHNLRVLKHEHGTERYIDQLGRPGHFMLHAVVAVLSYLVFGLMSPLIYGFSFRKSDNKDYKLATLAAASLVCIAILSIGKAYVRRPPKAYFQTFFYYISLGFTVSGVGYVAGHLINELLKKLGVFDSRAPPAAMPVLGAGAVNGPWSAY